ncbi:hypothetical protein BDB00DRAFT_871706 [Zychaea mexicana]|uniref:uncharacterized protein n=1 Tax=Zychaea mexicana TaxID=64656 RepID=UPI0022FDB9E5|nr:uncharacterized protein BDB00DRAFT_871706 [Zychaea mexicana]KAI9494184.1 hypothetical protein BDB00DRAFT_871706 [Zychaea mexicana]
MTRPTIEEVMNRSSGKRKPVIIPAESTDSDSNSDEETQSLNASSLPGPSLPSTSSVADFWRECNSRFNELEESARKEARIYKKSRKTLGKGKKPDMVLRETLKQIESNLNYQLQTVERKRLRRNLKTAKSFEAQNKKLNEEFEIANDEGKDTPKALKNLLHVSEVQQIHSMTVMKPC